MSNLNEQLAAELERARAAGLYRSLRLIASAQGPRIVLDGGKFLNFSSNDYLGLANDPLLKRAAVAAVHRYGVGAGASRLVCGNLAPYDELEQKLARFKGKEAAIVFGSGYTANVGTISALVGENDVVILDKLDHASIIDGARQSGATIRVYPHKDMRKLEALLQWAVGAVSRVRPRCCGLRGSRGNRDRLVRRSLGEGRSGLKSPPTNQAKPRILIITETIFSMDGDLAPLAEIVELKDRYGAWLMIDEAHATGLFGKHRRGLAEAVGVEERVEIVLGTLSKALGCAGGFVVGSQTLIDYLRNRARSLIYSTALPPAVCASASAAVKCVMGASGRRRCDQLWRNVRQMHDGLSDLGIQSESNSPIIPLIIGSETAAVEISQQLFERGIFVPAIRFPTVPKGKARLRVTATARHSAEDIQTFLKEFGELSR
jgi:7-keto-8-aminopelargonate synthetase-like enzyme